MTGRDPVVIDAGPPQDQLSQFVQAMNARLPVSIVNGNWSSALLKSAAHDLELATDPGWLAPDTILLFTPGNTDRPRAVLRAAQTWRDLGVHYRATIGLGPQDHSWIPGALSTPANLFAAWQAADLGIEVTLGYRAHPARLAHVTVAHLMPSMLTTTVDAHERGLLQALRTVVVRGGVSGALRRRCEGLGLSLIEMYTTTELGVVAARRDDAYEPLPGVAVRIDAERVLWASSPYLAIGYLTPGGPFRHDGDWATVGDTAAWAPGNGEALSRFVLGERVHAYAGDDAAWTLETLESTLRGVPGVNDLLWLPPELDLSERGVGVVVIEAPTARTSEVEAALATLPITPEQMVWARTDRLPRTAKGEVDRQLVRVLLVDGTMPTSAMPTPSSPEQR